MKQALGCLLIFIAFMTYIYSRNNEFDWNNLSDNVGKPRIILGIFYLLFGHIYGAVVGIIVGIYIIFKN
jgi:hypothetical protein